MVTAKPTKLTAAEFLTWEAAQTERHQFVDGEVFARSGASQAHVTVVQNLVAA